MGFLTLQNENGWEYVSLPKNRTVAILPYRTNENGEYEFLVNLADNPAWKYIGKEYEAITGLVENNEGYDEAALRELKEESGYEGNMVNLEWLDLVYVARFSNAMVEIYTIDITNAKRGEITTDGTDHEKNMKSIWVHEDEFSASYDMILTLAMSKFNQYIK